MIPKAASKPANVNKGSPAAEVAFAIGPLIGRVRSIMLSKLDAELQQFGLTGMQFAILKNVADSTADTAAELCRLMHYDTGSMTRMVDRLEEKGLVRRERSKDDRRVVSLRITGAGRTALPRLRDSAAGVIQRMLTGFSATEVNDLQSLLARMIENGQPGNGE
ncbi:MAG: MarR family winged helix-turn-helix transcriptional regulator [Steroidobacteraceae bacterium]